VTLNTTVLTTDLIYQSADFRITGRPTHNHSPKIVTLMYPSFTGFVTYAGIGSLWYKATSQLIAKWLAGPADLSMADVASVLQSKGAQLVAEAQRSTHSLGQMTFVLAGFEGGKPIVYVISNCETVSGQRYPTGRDLKITYRRIRENRKATVIITGSGADYISSADQRRLAYAAARSPHDSGRIRRRLEEIHLAAEEAEKKRKRKSTISPHCMVVSFRSDGSGILRLDQAAPEIPHEFPHVAFGQNMTEMLSRAMATTGIDLSKARIVQGAFASFGQGTKPKAEIPPCRFTVTSPDPAAGYNLRELAEGSSSLTRASAINDSGIVVGTAEPQGDRTYYVPWVWNNERTVILDTPGVANAVSGTGEVALELSAADGRSHAGVYAGGPVIDLHGFLNQSDAITATNSWASVINDAGLIGGCIQDRSGEDGERNPISHAVYLQPGGPVVALAQLAGARRYRAVGVNQSGMLLIMAAIGTFDTRCILWNTVDKTITYAGGVDSNIFPIAMTDSGVVLGQANNKLSQKVAALCTPGGAWQRLGTEDGWSPVDINDNGDVVGRVQIDGIDRPWLHLSTGQLILLPYLVSHNTIPTSINNVRQIVGTSQADHGSHAVLWEIPSGAYTRRASGCRRSPACSAVTRRV
jgi:hypothetical protein